MNFWLWVRASPIRMIIFILLAILVVIILFFLTLGLIVIPMGMLYILSRKSRWKDVQVPVGIQPKSLVDRASAYDMGKLSLMLSELKIIELEKKEIVVVKRLDGGEVFMQKGDILSLTLPALIALWIKNQGMFEDLRITLSPGVHLIHYTSLLNFTIESQSSVFGQAIYFYAMKKSDLNYLHYLDLSTVTIYSLNGGYVIYKIETVKGVREFGYLDRKSIEDSKYSIATGFNIILSRFASLGSLTYKNARARSKRLMKDIGINEMDTIKLEGDDAESKNYSQIAFNDLVPDEGIFKIKYQ